MKHLWVVLFLVAWSAQAEEAATSASDPFLALDSGASELPTPTTPPAAATTPPPPSSAPQPTAKSAPAPSTMDNPAPALGSEAPHPSPLAEELAAPTPEAVPQEASAPPPAAEPKQEEHVATPAKERDVYDDFGDYKQKERERQASEYRERQHDLFFHEAGEWQLSLDYNHRAYSGYNFNFARSSLPKVYADNSGPGLTVNYFPLHSLTFGRLGVGITGATYWSKFTWNQNSSHAMGSILSYGGRLVYEFDYLLGQALVPFVYGGYEWVTVKSQDLVVNGTTFSIPARNDRFFRYGAGLNINLNRIEPEAASRALANVGIKKFYITYTASQAAGDFGGLAHSGSLRFEF